MAELGIDTDTWQKVFGPLAIRLPFVRLDETVVYAVGCAGVKARRERPMRRS